MPLKGLRRALMEFRHLQGFIAVAEELHFGRAAAKIHMAQPALSQQIAALERELNVKLFDRNTRSVALTQGGMRLYPLAVKILDDVETAKRAVKSGGSLVGRLSFGFAGASAHAILPSLMRQLREDFPGIYVQLRGQIYTGQAVNELVEGKLDMALVRLPVSAPQLSTRVVQHERLVAVLPRDHRLATEKIIDVAELKDELFITFPGGGGSSVREAMTTATAEAGFVPNIVQEAPDSFTILDLVGAGVGVTLTVSSVADIVARMDSVVVLHIKDAPIIESAIAWRTDNDSIILKSVQKIIDRVFPTPLVDNI